MPAVPRDAWAGSRLGDVRPYAVTGGRTRPQYDLSLTSLLSTRPAGTTAVLSPECEAVLLLCSGHPRSVAELSARTAHPVQVTKILVSDLLDIHALALNPSAPRDADTDVKLLEDVLAGLRALA
ncbi:DUF742 domain-containing protein [Streptomyces sp. NPDC046977]|uniref:DUF742 domain-containing protein n=1 Tax=Streptomyces sp. NPDC046977 TaxID=3154703 RepID=UPI0033D1B5CD